MLLVSKTWSYLISWIIDLLLLVTTNLNWTPARQSLILQWFSELSEAACCFWMTSASFIAWCVDCLWSFLLLRSFSCCPSSLVTAMPSVALVTDLVFFCSFAINASLRLELGCTVSGSSCDLTDYFSTSDRSQNLLLSIVELSPYYLLMFYDYDWAPSWSRAAG